MFDIGFFELLVLFIVGLVVIGPERLPKVARTAGLWIGRIRQRFGEARSQFEDAVGADDVRRQLHNEAVLRRLAEENRLDGIDPHHHHSENSQEVDTQQSPPQSQPKDS
ncbi:MAG: Sec-independent protein translocase protein TatB [Cellvibrionaceae bacterium]